MRVLVDTSVWSLALRRGEGSACPEAQELRRLVSDHLVEITGPIRQEILSGIRYESQFARLEVHLRAFPDIPITTEDYVAAARYFNTCRSGGIQGSNTDFLICAVAAHHNLAVFTTDADFTQFASHIPIALHTMGAAPSAS